MNWSLVRRLAWHGLSQTVITSGGIFLALQGWPTCWQCLVIVLAGVVAGVKGVNALLTPP